MFYNLLLYCLLNVFYTASIFSEYEVAFSIVSFVFLFILFILEIKTSTY